MPLYEYRCTDCGHEFEKLAKVDDPPPTCPVEDCSGKSEKRPSRTSFVLKGGGWATDGYSSS